MKEQFSGLLLPLVRASLSDFGPIVSRFAEDLKHEAKRASPGDNWVNALSKLSVTGGVASNPLIFRRSACGVIVTIRGDTVVIFQSESLIVQSL